MSNTHRQTQLSDSGLALLMKGKARQLLREEKTREAFRDDVVDLLAAERGVVVRNTPLRSQGRCSFGRENEGREGIALFVPAEGNVDQ